MGKTVLAYARNYWEPGKLPTDGIGLVAKACYENIVNAYPKNEIIYLDASDYRQLRGIKNVDALFAVSSSIDRFMKICKPETSTLISVNESSLLRRCIRDHARKKGFSAKYLTAQDGIESNLRETKNVDFVLGFGAWSLFKSYTSIGIDPAKVFPIGWCYWSSFEESSLEQFGRKIVAYLGAISYRKGIDRIIELVHYVNEEFPEFWLELVGTVWNPHWKEELNDLRRQFPNNFVWREDRIHYGEKNWLDIKNEACFAIFPSYEEGLSGCAMDVINLGIPLFHSEKTGIEAAHESVSTMDFNSPKWRQQFAQIVSGGSKLWKEVSIEQKKAAFHQNQSNYSLSRAFKRISEGYIWPAASISGKISESAILQQSSFIQQLNRASIPDYKISQNQGAFNDHVKVHYLNSKSLGEVESVQMALYLAEKYNNFSRVIFDSDGGSSLDLVVENLTPSKSHESGKAIDLYLREYNNYCLTGVSTVHVLKTREFVRTKIYLIVYKSKRMLNIFRLKIISLLDGRNDQDKRKQQ